MSEAQDRSEVRYWRVTTLFWRDEKAMFWDGDTRLLALYLLTGPHRNMVGCYVLPKGYVLEDLSWDAKRLAQPFAQLLTDEFIQYDETMRVVLVVNALKYDPPQNPNQVTAALAQVRLLPLTRLLPALLAQAERFAERLAKRLREQLEQRYGHSLSVSVTVTVSEVDQKTTSEAATPDPSALPTPDLNDHPPTRTRHVYAADSVEFGLASHLRQRILEHLPRARVPPDTPSALGRWCEEIRLMIERDHRDPIEIRSVIDWCQSDGFWQANILSTGKLREKYDTLIAQAARKGARPVVPDTNRDPATAGARTSAELFGSYGKYVHGAGDVPTVRPAAGAAADPVAGGGPDSDPRL